MANFTVAQMTGNRISISCPAPEYYCEIYDLDTGLSIDNITAFTATWSEAYPITATLTLSGIGGGSAAVEVHDLFAAALLTGVT